MRSDAREAAFKIVFSELFTPKAERAFRFALYRQAGLRDEDCQFAEALVSCVEEHREELTKTLKEKVLNFDESRLVPTDKAILYVALAEIAYFDDIPAVVSADEAAGLARKYSTEKSADFVNGVLAGVINA